MRVSPCGCVFHSFSQFNNEIVLFLLLLYSQLSYLFFWGFFFRVFQLLFFNPFSELLLSIYFSLFSFFFSPGKYIFLEIVLRRLSFQQRYFRRDAMICVYEDYAALTFCTHFSYSSLFLYPRYTLSC